MRRITIGFLLAIGMLSQSPFVQGSAVEQQGTAAAAGIAAVQEEGGSVQSKAYRSGRRTYRAPRTGYTGGNRSGVAPGTNAGRTTTTPASGAGGRFGGFFGGLAAGSLLGSLLNPFGFGGWGGGGFSLLGVLFWIVLLYAAFRLVRRLRSGRRH